MRVLNRALRAAHLVWLCVGCVLAARSASAEESRISNAHIVVVIIRSDDEDCTVCADVSRLLELEIKNRLKWIMLEAHPSSEIEENVDTMMEQQLRESRADGAVLISKSANEDRATASLLVMDTAARKLHFRTVDIPRINTDDAAEASAIRIADALRAALLPLAGPETHIVQASDVEIAADVRAQQIADEAQASQAAPKFARVRLSVAMTGMYSLGGMGPRGGPTVGVRFLPLSQMSVGLSATLPVLNADVSQNGSTASFNVFLGRFQAAYEGRLHRRLTTSLGIRLGAGRLRIAGKSSPDYSAQTEQTVLIYVGGFGELNLLIHRRLSIPFTLQIGALPPGITIRFAGDAVARFGAAIFEAGAGLEIHL